MRQCISVLFTYIMASICFDFNQAIHYGFENNVNTYYSPSTTLPTIRRHIKINNASIENKENTNYVYHSKLLFHNISTNLSNQGIKSNYRPQNKIVSSYSPSKSTIVDSNDMDVVYNKRVENSFDPKKKSDYELLGNAFDFKHKYTPSLIKQLENQKQELSAGYADFLFKTNQFKTSPREIIGSSNDHYKSRYLTAFVTPTHSQIEMHPNLHNIEPHADFQNAIIVSHATGNEPSLMTTTSINLLTSMENTQKFLTTFNDVKYIASKKTNQFLTEEEDTLSKFNKANPNKGSKQYRYAPRRPNLERVLAYSNRILPYPPSFISITTTEKSLYNYEAEPYKIPDLFTHRNSISLWDSYIPSWQISEMYKKIKNTAVFKNNNLHTLAITKQ
ncbi:uncharacterized protein ACRADG_006316 [Cochliomyia hominivorax]